MGNSQSIGLRISAMIWANIVAPAGKYQEPSPYIFYRGLTSVSMEERTKVSDIDQNMMTVKHLRVDYVHYTI